MPRLVLNIRRRSLRIVIALLAVGTFLFLSVTWLLSVYQHTKLTADIIELARAHKLITFLRTEQWGLGNEMFALASTVCIAKRYPGVWTVCLQPHANIRSVFDLHHLPDCDANILLNRLRATMFTEKLYAVYDSQVENLPTDTHLVLNRFFQSWRYFADCEEEIRRLYIFESSLRNSARQILVDGVHRTLRCTTCFESAALVGVHVRRGNMARAPDLIEIGYTVADSAYIHRAIKHMQDKISAENPRRRFVIVVISDDMSWCREVLTQRDDVLFVSTGDAMLDMTVLSQCKHIVITVGSFGWWGGWLATNSTVVYYNDWPRKGSRLDRTTSRSDYYPTAWISL